MAKEEIKKEFIECECGTHLLQIMSEVEYFNDSFNHKTRVRQEFDLAMFSYGKYNRNLSIWERMKIAYNFIKTGIMHEDQLILNPDAAKKLADFINNNIVPTEKEEVL